MYTFMRWVIGVALGFYFRRIDTFHAERAPLHGPVLFVSNHPNSLTDSFVIGASVSRKVNFVATVQLFRFAPLKWLLTRSGVIPINRVKDDPKAMRTVADTFNACFEVLARGEAIGLFPEGITYEDAQLKEVKSGAARIALEFAARNSAPPGLQIVPVGLTYSGKERYRSEVLVHFGEPLSAAAFVGAYAENKKATIHRLTAEIEQRIKALILHLPELKHQRLIAGVKRLYLQHSPPRSSSEELILSQSITGRVEDICRNQPERAALFASKLAFYERSLQKWRVSESDLTRDTHNSQVYLKAISLTLIVLLAAPVGVYGWLHRLVPFFLVKQAQQHFAEPGKKKAQASTVAILSGIICFGLAFSLYVILFHHYFGSPATFWYALSIPLSSLLAHYYVQLFRRCVDALRTAFFVIRAPSLAERLKQLAAELIREIEAAAAQSRQEA